MSSGFQQTLNHIRDIGFAPDAEHSGEAGHALS